MSKGRTPLLGVDELFENLERPNWLVVDCRFDLEDPEWGREAHREAHIPGAVYADLERDLSASPTGRNGRHPLPAPDDLAAAFSQMGIGPGTTVVGYDGSGGPFAARLWWSLRYLGHEAVAVLDGGWPAWQEAGYPTEAGLVDRRRADFVPRPDRSMLVSAEELLASLAKEGIALLDARAPSRFRGDEEPYDPIAGRIPGARNHYWKENLKGEKGPFRERGELRSRFLEVLRGKDPGQAISYCGSGVTAAHNALAMAVAGLPTPRVYAGSWSEWCSDPGRPIAEGPPE